MVKLQVLTSNYFYSPIFIIFLFVSALFTSCGSNSSQSDTHYQPVTMALMPHSFSSYTAIIAKERGFFKAEGLLVRFHPSTHGKATFAELVGGKIDFALSSETPFVNAVMQGAKVSTIAVTIKAHNHLALVARKDKAIRNVTDLKGKKVAITSGSNGEYFFDTLLLLYGLQPSEVKIVHLKPGQMFDAIMEDDVDGIVTWNPQMHKAKEGLGERGSTYYAEGLYSPFFIVTARNEYIASYPEIIIKMVRALHKSSIYIRGNLGESHRIAAKYLKTDPATLGALSAKYDFSLSLDQAFITSLENQSKWAVKLKQLNKNNLPNYLDHIYLKALEAVAPENVTIIR